MLIAWSTLHRCVQLMTLLLKPCSSHKWVLFSSLNEISFFLYLNYILIESASHCWIVLISQVIPYDCGKTNDNPLYIFIRWNDVFFFGVVFPIQWALAGAGGGWGGGGVGGCASNSKIRLITYCKRWMCFVAIHLSLLLNNIQSSKDGKTFILHKR